MKRRGQAATRDARHDWGAWIDLGLALVAFGVPLALYLQTLAPGVLDADYGEFQTNIYKLGVSHTGYPLWFMLAKLWAVLVPVGTMAWRANLFAAVVGAAACALLYAALRVWMESRAAALLAALALGLSRVEWSQSVVPDVYTLNTFLGILVFLAFVLWRMGRLDLRAAVFVYGLALTHHRMMIWFAPGLAVLVLLREGWDVFAPRRLAGLLASFFFPLLLYAYLPLRGDSDVGTEYHRANNTAVLALDVFNYLRLQPAFLWSRLGSLYLPLLAEQFTPVGLVFGLFGFAALWLNRVPRGWPAALPPRMFVLLVALVYLFTTLFGLAFWVLDSEIFFLPSYLSILLFAATGLAVVMDGLGAWSRTLAGNLPRVAQWVRGLPPLALFALFACGLGWLAAENVPDVNLSTSDEAQARWQDLLAQPLETRAVIAGPWESITPLEYDQYVEGRRPDLRRSKLIIYQEQLKLVGDTQTNLLNALSRDVDAGAPVYLTIHPSLTETLGNWTSRYALVPVDSLWRVLPRLVWEPARPVKVSVGEELQLDTVAFSESNPRAGDFLAVRLDWHALEAGPARYRFSLRLRDSVGGVWWQQAGEPNGGLTPTRTWAAGKTVQDVVGILLPPDLLPGAYWLELAAVEADSGVAATLEPKGAETLAALNIAAPASPVDLARLNIPQRLDLDFGSERLRGMGLDQTSLRTGDRVELRLWWQGGDGRAGGHYQSLLGSTELALIDVPALAAGEIIQQRFSFQIPLSANPGERLLLLRRDGDPVALANLHITSSGRTLDPPAPKREQVAQFGNGIALVGYDLDRTTARPNDKLTVTVYWQALERGGEDWQVFVHLLDSGGRVRAQHDGVPGEGAIPVSLWIPREFVTDRHTLALPADLPAGNYRLEVGLYRPADNVRLPLLVDGVPGADHLVLDQPITVTR